MDDRNDTGRSLGLLAGGALVLLGGWFLLRTLGIIPAWFGDLWARASWPVALIVIGVIVVAVSSRGGLSIRGPVPGSRLYRSRTDKWVEGVLGGLGAYLGIDPVVLRLAFICLMFLNAWSLVVAYVIMAVVIPKEPE